MVTQPTERRTFTPRTSTFRASRGRVAAKAFGVATAILMAGMAIVPSLSSRIASADVCVEERATQDVVALVEATPEELHAVALDVPALEQNPELPTGCESVALTNALLSYGFDLEKTDIADAWLARSDSDFVNAFMGDPYTTDGHSCMAPAIVEAANAYLASQSSSLEAVDLTGATIEDVLDQVLDGNPVVAWCTIGLEDPGTAYQVARVDERTYRLYANSHCVVVSGYDLDAGTIQVSDSLAGEVTYDLQLFAERYYQLGAQAVVIA